MKKQVALLLATVMTLSLLPVNVFAATNNFVDNRLTVPDKTVLLEHGILPQGSYLQTPSQYRGNAGSYGDPEHYADGTDLVIPLQRDVLNGYQLKLTLANAKWFFRNASDDESYGTAGNSTFEPYDEETGIGKGFYFPQSGGKYGTYRREKDRLLINDFIARYYDGDFDDDVDVLKGALSTLSYTTIQGTKYVELPYTLDVSASDQTVATVEIQQATSVLNEVGLSNYMLRIPLVTYIADSNKEVTVTIDGGNSSTVTNQKIIFANTADGKTNTTIKEVVVGRDVFALEPLTINELRVGTIRDQEIVRLTLPTGYHFSENWGEGNGKRVQVSIESGLAWGQNGSAGVGRYSGKFNGAVGASLLPDNLYSMNYGRASGDVNDKLTGNFNDDIGRNDSVLLIYLGDITESTQLRGSIVIENLEIWADEHAYIPTAGQEVEIKMTIDAGTSMESITSQTITVAKRSEWSIGLKTLNAVPTLVSGRYTGASWDGMDANDNHKTARVQLYENAANAWWSTRTTVLALPATDNSNVKGAKFRKVKVDDKSEIASPDVKGRYQSSLYSSTNNPRYNGTALDMPGENGVYLNDGEKHGAITVNDNKITINNLTINTGKKGSINFDLWVSIEYGFGRQTGDLKLSIDPSSTSMTGVSALPENLSSCVIAHVIDPIEVTTAVSDVKIGYQYVPTQEIQIKELAAHALLQGKTVKVSISDLISDDLVFANDIKIEVVSGDLKIKNVLTTGQGGFTSQSNSWLDAVSGSGALSFDVERESNTASTIKISNVGVKVNRTIPVSNKYPYRAVVWGTAVAENYGLVDNRNRTWKADFNTVGDFKDYLNIVSSAEDASSVLTQEVRVAVGENYYTVNGKTFSMDAEAYISTASNSTMVPVRFVANALGLRDDQILWDDSTKTVTITAPNKIVQFTAGSTKMKLNNVEVTMQSPDLKPVSAEIKSTNNLGRMYLPFRALGEAFGIPVTWEADTKTAVYNAGANKNSNSSVTNTTPTQQ